MAIHISYTQKRRTVKIEDAGNDQYYGKCLPDTIILTARLNDTTNLKNTTLEWVQIFGPVVTLSATDQLVVSFPTTDTEDKIFRFYLDRGTNREQFADIRVYYTPTSLAENWAKTAYKSTWEETMPALVRSSSFIIDNQDLSESTVLIPLEAEQFDFDLSTLPSLSGNQYSMEVFVAPPGSAVPSVLYASYDVNNFPTRLLLPFGAYKVRVTYKLGERFIVIDSPRFVSNGDDVTGLQAVQTIVKPLSQRTSSAVNLTRLINQLESVQSTQVSGLNTKSNAFTVINRYTPVKLHPDEYPALNDSGTLSKNSISTLANLFRADPGSIGNN